MGLFWNHLQTLYSHSPPKCLILCVFTLILPLTPPLPVLGLAFTFLTLLHSLWSWFHLNFFLDWVLSLQPIPLCSWTCTHILQLHNSWLTFSPLLISILFSLFFVFGTLACHSDLSCLAPGNPRAVHLLANSHRLLRVLLWKFLFGILTPPTFIHLSYTFPCGLVTPWIR